MKDSMMASDIDTRGRPFRPFVIDMCAIGCSFRPCGHATGTALSGE
jgi:hypothetical protein